MTSDTRVSLPDLGAETLLELGGLKTRCEAPIKCTAHGHLVPCEACVHDDLVGTFCSACNKAFDTPPLPGDRECASVEQFRASGKIAFEDAALAALNERERKKKPKPEKKEREALETETVPAPASVPEPAPAPVPDRRRPLSVDLSDDEPAPDDGVEDKTWQDFKRKHRLDYYAPKRRRPEKAPPKPAAPTAPLETPNNDVEKIEAEPAPIAEIVEPAPEPPGPKWPRRRRKAPKVDSGPAPETPTPTPRRKEYRDPYDDGMAVMSLWVSLFAAVVGAYIWYRSPMVENSSGSGWYLLGFSLATLFIWLCGTLTLRGKEPAHGTMSWWSPAIWAFCAAPWPGLGAAVLCNMVASTHVLWKAAFAFIFGLIPVLFAIWAVMRIGTRWTMSEPWPAPMNEDHTSESGWYLGKIVATIALNVHLWNLGSAMWHEAHSAPPPPISSLSAPLASLTSAVNSVKNPSQLRSGPEMDKIKQSLANIDALPKPAPGNVAEARKLQQQAAPLYSKADWQGAYNLYKRAHEIAPALDDVAIQLGATEAALGKATDAIRHLDEGLSINPRNSTAWKMLGDVELRAGMGSAASVERAADYYLVSWWFAKDRKQALQAFNKMAERDAVAKEAIQKLTTKIGNSP